MNPINRENSKFLDDSKSFVRLCFYIALQSVVHGTHGHVLELIHKVSCCKGFLH